VRNSVKKWYGFGVVLMKSGEKKWKSEKKLQKVKGNILARAKTLRGQEENIFLTGLTGLTRLESYLVFILLFLVVRFPV
jgi:hypothetical protein